MRNVTDVLEILDIERGINGGNGIKAICHSPGNPALAGGERKDIAKKAAMGEKGGSLTIMEGGNYSISEINAAKYMADLGNDVVLRPPVGTRVTGAIEKNSGTCNINNIVVMPK